MRQDESLNTFSDDGSINKFLSTGTIMADLGQMRTADWPDSTVA